MYETQTILLLVIKFSTYNYYVSRKEFFCLFLTRPQCSLSTSTHFVAIFLYYSLFVLKSKSVSGKSLFYSKQVFMAKIYPTIFLHPQLSFQSHLKSYLSV
jgi:hypothetical protein